jgi:hypothetical protein
MHTRSAVEPEGRLVHDPALQPLPGEGGQIRLGVRELSPDGHDQRSLRPGYPLSDARQVKDTVLIADE